MTVTATIEAIDAKKKRVTLVNVKVGDQVVLTYTEALAVSVEPAKKK